MSRKIPDRWLEYSPYGTVIEGTQIICFKVPLEPTVHVQPSLKWTVNSLLKEIPNLSAVIDLTNTSRYYKPSDLQMTGIKHVKIGLQGRIIPRKEEVRRFMDTIDELMNTNHNSLIGVHCTHGLNRTGYMVSRYMRDRLGMPADVAIQRFEMARGYRIERPNYIADLLRNPPCPPVFGNQTVVVPIGQQSTSIRRRSIRRRRR